jgi:hypothetical protein
MMVSSVVTKWMLYVVMSVTAPLTPVQPFETEARCQLVAEVTAHDYDKLPVWKRPMLICLPKLMSAPEA